MKTFVVNAAVVLLCVAGECEAQVHCVQGGSVSGRAIADYWTGGNGQSIAQQVGSVTFRRSQDTVTVWIVPSQTGYDRRVALISTPRCIINPWAVTHEIAVSANAEAGWNVTNELMLGIQVDSLSVLGLASIVVSLTKAQLVDSNCPLLALSPGPWPTVQADVSARRLGDGWEATVSLPSAFVTLVFSSNGHLSGINEQRAH